MSNILINEFDAITGQNIQRKMTDAEMQQYEIDQADMLKRKEFELQKALKKQSAIDKLEALGLTFEDLQALGL